MPWFCNYVLMLNIIKKSFSHSTVFIHAVPRAMTNWSAPSKEIHLPHLKPQDTTVCDTIMTIWLSLLSCVHATLYSYVG